MVRRQVNSADSNRTPHPATLVLGVGNILLGDEGVGVRVIQAMKEKKLPGNVELLDGGTASLDLLDSLSNREKVIIVDAVKGGGKPGTLYHFSLCDITAERKNLNSLHQIGLLETLAMAEYLGCAPHHVTIYGIEPKKVDWGLELSPEVAAVVPRVIELLMAEL